MKIGASVETQLQSELDRLLCGELSLNDLTPALQAWFVAGYTAGRDTHPDVAQLTWERDLWYFVACNPSKKPADFYAHIENALWSEAVN
ncbi:hypothetical protein BH10ACT6_BH10ACT6_01250 [soil metagenome]